MQVSNHYLSGTLHKVPVGMYKQQRFKSVLTSTQSDLSLSFLPEEMLNSWQPTEHSSNTLIRLCRPGSVAQSVTTDPGIESLIPALSHTFAEMDHEIISMAILLLPPDSKRFVVSHK